MFSFHAKFSSITIPRLLVVLTRFISLSPILILISSFWIFEILLIYFRVIVKQRQSNVDSRLSTSQPFFYQISTLKQRRVPGGWILVSDVYVLFDLEGPGFRSTMKDASVLIGIVSKSCGQLFVTPIGLIIDNPETRTGNA
jgi:hypothetical protein